MIPLPGFISTFKPSFCGKVFAVPCSIMKKFIFVITLLLIPFLFTRAQSVRDTIVVVPGREGLYFYHVVTKEETLFSLSRKYHVDPKELALFNNLNLKSELKLFQLVKVPLNNQNFDQSSSTGLSGYTPLFHKVLKGETLFHIGQIHDTVPLNLLQRWNNLSGNEVKTGQYLIVGWLKTGSADQNPVVSDNHIATNAPETDSGTGTAGKATRSQEFAAVKNPPSNRGNDNSDNSPARANTGNNNAFLSEVIASENASRHISRGRANTNISNDDAFSVRLPEKSAETNKSVLLNQTVNEKKEAPAAKKPVEKVEIDKKKLAVQKIQKPTEEKPDSFALMLNQVTHTRAANNSAPKPAAPSVQPSAAGEVLPAGQTTSASAANVTEPLTSTASSFEQEFMGQTDNGENVLSRKGAAGWFKSNVKPGSGTYYALCNDLPRGTVVEVINPLNQKSVLVKVLDVIPKGAENYNLIIKISDAAMGDLGVSQSRFWCEIQYPNQSSASRP